MARRQDQRTIKLEGKRTSISVEPAFWDGVRRLAVERSLTVHGLLAQINAQRTFGGLTQAIRLVCVRALAEEVSARLGVRSALPADRP